jgi:NAD(P)-dependent dehydrogenase (short-subunit alcohol dehydrogenase family)
MATELRGLEGKKVLITGAAKGQGFSHAKAFAEAGCDIAAIDITHPVDPDLYAVATPEMMDATVAAIEERGQRCVALPCDIRDEDQVRAAVQKALEEFDGVIDVIVNNAGMAALDTVHGMRSHVMNAVIDTNLKGAMYVTKYAVDNMIGRRSGKIINISSAVTGSGHAMLSHYVASKHAINGLTASWAMELAEFNINVNAICPATIRPGEGQGSGMVLGLSKEMDMEPEAAYNHFSEMGNMPGEKWRAEPHHISDAVLFLASENAEMITGAIIPVDCGQMTR